MSTTTTQVNGTTTPNDWTLSAGASKQVAVNQPDDDDTTYIDSGSSSNTVQTFTLSPSLSTGDTITEIVIHARVKRTGGSNANHVFGYSFTPQGGGTQTSESGNNTATNTWADESYAHSGLSVLWGSDLTIYIKNTQARPMALTTFYVVITYTPGGGGSTQPPRTMHQMQMRINP
ncbi:MAG: hypothetical protein R3C43_18460 [Chloroflexota bacterium]